MAELKVTSVEDFKQAAAGQVVEIPGFDDKPMRVRLRRVSMLKLIESDILPNELIEAAAAVMEGKDKKTSGETIAPKELARILETIAEECLLEPKYEDVKDYLLDEQKLAIFRFSQVGIKALRPFRGGSKPKKDSGNK